MSEALPTIYFCDLTHTAQCVSSDFFPYGTGCVAAYLKGHCEFPVQVELFKFPHDAETAILNNAPDIIGLSHYMWNSEITLEFARLIKKHYPETLIVLGGPNFPDEMDRKKQWLIDHPYVDFFIVKEGEIPFTHLTTEFLKNKDVEQLKRKKIPNCASVIGSEFFFEETSERVADLDDIPSPFLLGLMDKFMDTLSWVITETNRGCPFTCAYCSEGARYYNKVAKRSNEKVKKELEYIAKNARTAKMIYMADSNFIMFKENLEICEFFAETQKKYGWPSFIGCSTGKNRKELVIQGADILKGSITLAASVQSFDTEVLKNSSRSNISTDQMVAVANATKRHGMHSYTELIACLPGDSLASHRESMKRSVELGFDLIKTHTLMLLEGTSLASKEKREKFGFKTKVRPVTKSFGQYKFFGETIHCIETEELVCETNTLPFKDYIECRKLQLTVHNFYNDGLFEELHSVLRCLGISIWDWLVKVHDDLDNAPQKVQDLYLLFEKEITEELWDSKDELDAFVEEHLDSFLTGERGNNVTFKMRVLLLRDAVKEVFNFGFEKAVELLNERDFENKEIWLDYLQEQKEIAILRKDNVFDRQKSYTFNAKYDRIDLKDIVTDEEDTEKLPVKRIEAPDLHPHRFVIEHGEDQKKFLEEHDKFRGQDVIQLTALLNRVPAKQLYRQVIEMD